MNQPRRASVRPALRFLGGRAATLLFSASCLASSAGRAGTAPPAGFVQILAPTNNPVLVAMPFEPFDPSLDAVLAGQLTGAADIPSADGLALWLPGSQGYTNAWLAAGLPAEELNGLWLNGFGFDAAPLGATVSAGDAFWIENRQPFAQRLFLAGRVPVTATTSRPIVPGMNLLGIPYAAAAPLSGTSLLLSGGWAPETGYGDELMRWRTSDGSYLWYGLRGALQPGWYADGGASPSADGLRLGEGFWYLSYQPSPFLWTETRPYAAPFADTNALPRIAGIAFDTAAPSSALTILSEPGTPRSIDILTLDAATDGAVAATGWSHAARVPSLSQAALVWTDQDIADVHARFYLVGRADIDTDADGTPDLLELHVHGTDPGNPDTDGDGATDTVELALGRDPLVADLTVSLPFFEGFEPPAVQPGSLDGQNGWTVNIPGAATVQASVVFAGTAALRVDWPQHQGTAVVSRAFGSPLPSTVWIDFRQQVFPGDVPAAPEGAASLAFDRAGRLVVCGAGQWSALTNHAPRAAGDWVRLTLRLDYGARAWTACLDGIVVADGLAFSTARPCLTNVAISGHAGVYDDLYVGAERPPLLSLDWDSLPDDWELLHFGNLAAVDAGDPDGDGLSNLQEYRLGTDPNSPDSDGDGMPDGWEVFHGLDPLDASDAALDPDGDGMSNLREHLTGSDPRAFELDPAVRAPGLRAEFYSFGAQTLSALPAFVDSAIDVLRIDARIAYPTSTVAWAGLDARFADRFAVRHAGWLHAAAQGTYTFHLASDEGSRLWIGDAAVLEDDGLHAFRERSISLVLAAGFHPLRVEYFENVGPAGLALEWTPPGGSRASVPASVLWHVPATNDAPFVKVSEPAPAAVFGVGNAVPFAASVWDADDAVACVDFLVSGEWIGRAVAPPYAVVWSNAPAGAFHAVAVATDARGATRTSLPVAFDVVPPPAGYAHGLDAAFFDFAASLAAVPPDLAARTPDVARVDDWVNYPSTNTAWQGLPPAMADTFASRHSGFLFVPVSGDYTLHLASDDGSRLWLDGELLVDNDGLHSWREYSAPATLARGPHALRVEFFGNTGSAGLVLRWTGPSLPKAVVPRRCLLHPAGNPDTDGDGMPDWWESEHGLDPADAADAALDPDGDSLDNLEEYLRGTDPHLADTDGDGLPDAWEVLHGTKPFVADAAADPDGDGLDNAGERLAGTNPLNADSDGDGVIDGVEVLQVFTDPLGADLSGSFAGVQTLRGSDLNAVNGSWLRDGAEVRAVGRRGALAYTNLLAVSQAGVHRVGVTGHGARIATATLLAYVDGEYVGTRGLAPLDGRTNTVYFFTQWLAPGEHSLVLAWNNVFSGARFSVSSVALAVPDGGADADANGVPDWLDHRVANSCAIDNGGVASLVSPYCLKGRTAFLDLTSLSPAVPVRGLPGGRWYADVPLSVDGATPVVASFEGGAFAASTSVEWVPFNILAATDLTLRRGDALRLTAAPAGALSGSVALEVVGVTNYAAQVGSPVVHRFDQPGAYTLRGIWTDGAAAAANTVVVTVAAAAFPTNGVAAWMGRQRLLQLPGVPASNVVLVASVDTALGTPAPSGTGVAVALTAPETDQPRYLAAALPGPDGPILDSVRLDTFWERHTVEGWLPVVDVLPDGTRVIQNRLVAGFLPDTVELRILVFAAGASLDDGSSTRTIRNSDLSPQGEYLFRMLLAPGGKAPCHYVRAYQDGQLVGQ